MGEYVHVLDLKSRFAIPSSWRDRIQGPKSLYVLPDVEEKCLCVFPVREMTLRLERSGNFSITDLQARHFSREIASRSDLVDWDSQGRIRIKDDLLAYAGIRKRVTLVANFRFFELWDPDALAAARLRSPTDVRIAARHVGF